MARWNFHQRIAVFYIYLITFILAEPIVQLPVARRGIFGDLQPVKYDQNGEPVVQDITKSAEPLLEVSNHIQNHLGEWHDVRSLGGPMAMKWLSLHSDGHPNTTVKWSNGTHVAPHQVHEIIQLAKRWGWGDAAIELTLWGTRAFTVTNVGLVAGFAAAVVAGLIGYAGYALAHAINPGWRSETPSSPMSSIASKLAIKQIPGGHWPSTADMQNAVHSSLQDMADHDYQGACYDAVINLPVYGPGEGCPIQEFGQLGFCSWPNGGSCTTPSCQLNIGQSTQCNGDRAADGQYGK
ncbi:hypothetical protein IFR04_007018 [Cadophora malorum]|uniref:Uncharacterized protein n=1 Tax=Cadophora malorum TaxID=108018 RepID=A0A8H7TJ51_9HELO|nr:hypothetical protein IFR04_007018 [Cadophora malorum]